MKSLHLGFALPCLLAATAALSIPAHAQTYAAQVQTAGSSAQWGVFAEAAYQLAKAEGASTAHHYTAKSSACASPGCAYLLDSRNANIPKEPGNIWIVWNSATGHVWSYTSVDSTVGVRAFEAAPRAKVTLASASILPPNGSNALAVWDDGSTDTALPTAVYNAVNGVAVTAANTDIRPEDALFATTRTLTSVANGGLGYLNSSISSGNCQIGFSYQSEVTTTSGPIATPVAFVLSGNDPCSGTAVPAFTTVPVGAAPIIFIANKSNASGLGSSAVTNVQVSGSTNDALKLFDGDECDASLVGGSSSVKVTPILREPLSGTMNTTEFTNFRLSGTTGTQEKSVTTATNPLNLNCTAGGGKRIRGIGTGDVVKGVNATADSIGYAFFSFEALVPASFPNVKYLKLDGVDPLAISSSSTYTGALPTCGTSTSFQCPHGTPSSSFFNLREGLYRSWSEYRVVTDASGAHLTNAQTLVAKAQTVTDTILPDFVPFKAVCGTTSAKDDPGLSVYREHFNAVTNPYTNTSVTGNDGPLPANVTCTVGGSRTLKARTLGGGTEAGGDVGGVIHFTPSGSQPTVPGPTGHRQ